MVILVDGWITHKAIKRVFVASAVSVCVSGRLLCESLHSLLFLRLFSTLLTKSRRCWLETNLMRNSKDKWLQSRETRCVCVGVCSFFKNCKVTVQTDVCLFPNCSLLKLMEWTFLRQVPLPIATLQRYVHSPSPETRTWREKSRTEAKRYEQGWRDCQNRIE